MRKEDEKDEVNSEDENGIIKEGGNTLGKVVIESSGDTLGDLGAAVQLRSEEISGQRVIEVDTSDEEVDLDGGETKDVEEQMSSDQRFCRRDNEPKRGREVVVEVESDDEEPVLEDMDSMGTGLSNIPVFNSHDCFVRRDST